MLSVYCSAVNVLVFITYLSPPCPLVKCFLRRRELTGNTSRKQITTLIKVHNNQLSSFQLKKTQEMRWQQMFWCIITLERSFHNINKYIPHSYYRTINASLLLLYSIIFNIWTMHLIWTERRKMYSFWRETRFPPEFQAPGISIENRTTKSMCVRVWQRPNRLIDMLSKIIIGIIK